jgi:hypothetical protein
MHQKQNFCHLRYVANTSIRTDLQQSPHLYGQTCGLVPRHGNLHSFGRESLNKRKQSPKPLADDTIQTIQPSQVITMASALRRWYRRQERLGYDISRFCLITWQGRKGEKTKRNGREIVGGLAGESLLYLLLPVEYTCFLTSKLASDNNKWKST